MTERLRAVVLEGRSLDWREAREALERSGFGTLRSAGEAQLREALAAGADAVLADAGAAVSDPGAVVALAGELPVVVLCAAGGCREAVEWLRAGAADVVFRGGEPGEVFGSKVREAVERGRLRGRAAAAEARARSFFDRLPVGLYRSTPSGWFLEVNRAMVELFGAPDRETLLGTPLAALCAEPDDPLKLERRIGAEGCVRGLEVLARRLDGSTFWASVSARAARCPRTGQIVLEGAVLDVTERRLALEELRESELRYRTVVEASPSAIAIHAGGRLLYANPAAVRLVRAARPEEILGRDVFDFVPLEDRAQVAERWRQVLEEGRWLDFREWRLRALDGTVVEVEAASVPTVYRRERAILTVLVDLAERKRIERELRKALERAEEADRLKSAFIANLSHEIRTPLNVILGYASLITEELAQRGDASFAELVDPMERSARRLLRTLDGILDLSRFEVGEFPLRPVRLRVAKVLEEAAAEYRLLARKKGLPLRVEIEEPEAEVLFDESCLGASLGHLLDNAVKFTASGSITVRLFRGRDGRLRIEVRDTGVGISPAFLPRAFEPFTQQDPGPTRRFEGAGLGLALVRRYLAANGATISVRSRPGQSSSFEIRFAAEPDR